MKKKLMALLAAVAAVFGFGLAAEGAMAVDYGATVPVTGNVVTYSIPAGTFQPYETVTVTFDDVYVSDVVLAAQKSKQFQANADGGLNLRYILTDAGLKAAQEGKMPTITATGETSGNVYTITLVAPATGEGDQSGDKTDKNDGNKGNSAADTGAAIAPYAIAAALLAAAGIAIFSVRKANTR